VSILDTKPYLDECLMLPKSASGFDELPTRPMVKVRRRRRASSPKRWDPPFERLDRRR